ncbi:MAG: hypothetical protein IJX88_02740 [Clostridia bacterium]|nr:hypothetical protein [Clostridia bacterium]
MKTKVLVSTAIASLLTLASLSTASAKPALANGELRYYYPEYAACDTYTSETIYCTDMVEDYTTLDYGMPFYYGTDDLTNACGAVAGSIVVGYFDRDYPTLISNWVSYYPASGRFKMMNSTYVSPVMQELYTLMRTNVDDVGVSQDDCKNGLQTYFADRGYSLTYTTVESNSVFNYNLYKQAIDAQKPVLIFSNNATICSPTFSESQGKTVIANQNITGGHIMVGYGYSTITYYNGSTPIRTDNYILVSTGRASLSDAYVNVGSTSWLVDGYKLTVS